MFNRIRLHGSSLRCRASICNRRSRRPLFCTTLSGGRRWLSSSTTDETAAVSTIYDGSLSTALRGMKLLSLSSCCATSGGAPFLFLLDFDSPLHVRIATATVIAGFGLFTTLLYDYVSKPYVHRLAFDEGANALVLRTVDLLGRFRDTVVPLNSPELVAKWEMLQAVGDDQPDERRVPARHLKATMRPFVNVAFGPRRLFYVGKGEFDLALQEEEDPARKKDLTRRIQKIQSRLRIL